MSNWLATVFMIVALFLVILVGWIARRRGYLNRETTTLLSRFVVDIAMPALILTQLLRTINPDGLLRSWFVPVLGVVIVVIPITVGAAVTPLLSGKAQRPTFTFLVGIANSIYLPLPIVSALYGAASEGVSVLLLFNVGATLALWTLGIWALRGGKPDADSLRHLVRNPGLLATVGAIVLALAVPASRTLEQAPAAGAPVPVLVGSTIIQALVMVGSLTIPLSLVLTGAQLGELDISDHRASLALAGVIVGRLLIAPAVTIALVQGAAMAGFVIPEVPRMVGYIISFMPVAISCSMLTARFGGDVSLAARGIFYSTLLSIVTVPALLLLVQRLHL